MYKQYIINIEYYFKNHTILKKMLGTKIFYRHFYRKKYNFHNN